MKITKNVLGSLAAASLLAAQPALAASEPARASAPATETEELVGSPLLIIAAIIGALIALELTGAINIIDGDDDSVSA